MTIYDTQIGADLPTEPTRRRLYADRAKRVLDVVLVLLALPFIVPIMTLVAGLVALDGGKPFYAQARIGRDGRVYRMWKLRSMVHDADSRLEGYLQQHPEARAEWDSTQKLRDDPRITPMGRIIRKTSLDELPQLFNVLSGDMSLVGPRPMMVCQKALYPGQDYYRLRPGITGLWQITDRNASTFAARAEFDSSYRRDLSLATDLRILVATVGVVLKGTGC